METLIPAFLRRQRNQRRLTLENLSAKVGMSPQHWSEIESGKRDPRLSSIERMAEAMGMSRGQRDGAALHAFDQALLTRVEQEDDVFEVKPPPYRSRTPIIDRPFEDAEWFNAITWPFENWRASRFSDGSFGVW